MKIYYESILLLEKYIFLLNLPKTIVHLEGLKIIKIVEYYYHLYDKFLPRKINNIYSSFICYKFLKVGAIKDVFTKQNRSINFWR